MTFHDGRPLTSSDVQFTLDAIRDPRRGVDHLRPMLDDVEAVELITPLEIRLVLKRPSAWVLRALAEIPILPMHIYDGSLLAGGALVGSGPWKFVSNKNGVVHLTRYDKYWGGKPAIADVEFVLRARRGGRAHGRQARRARHHPRADPGALARAGERARHRRRVPPLELAPPRLRYLEFNASRPPLDDRARPPRARAARSIAATIAKRVFDGLARPALWPIWPGGLVDGPEAPVPDFDPAAAAKLLDAAGWVDTDKDGIRDQGGQAAPPRAARRREAGAAGRLGPAVEAAARLLRSRPRAASASSSRSRPAASRGSTKQVGEGKYDLVELQWTGMVDMDVTRARRSARIRATAQLAARRSRARCDGERRGIPPSARKLAQRARRRARRELADRGHRRRCAAGPRPRRVQGVRVWDGWIDLTQLSLDASAERKP